MMQTIQLLPGVRLHCRRDDRFKHGCMSISLVRPMVREEAGMNALLPAVLLRGCDGHPDMTSVTHALDDLYGATVRPLVRRIGDYQTTGFFCLMMDDRFALPGDRVLEPLVQLVGQILTRPVTENGVFREDYLAGERQNLLDAIQANLNDKQVYALNQLVKYMAGNDSFGVPRVGEKEDVAAITPDALWNHHQKVLRESPVEIIYVGSTPAEDLARWLTPIFAGLQREPVALPPQTGFSGSDGGSFHEDMAVEQTKLCMGFVTPITANDPEYYAMRLMNLIFGSGMTSKLFMNVREKKSLCYAIGSSYAGEKGVLTVDAGVDPRQEENARAEILHQLAECAAGNITAEEMEAAKQAVRSTLRAITDSPRAMENYDVGVVLGTQRDTPEEYAARLDAVTAEQVAAAARTVKLHTEFSLRGGQV